MTHVTSPDISPSIGEEAMFAMRRTRRRHRIQDMEWFEALYRVYITALIVGGVILFLSGFVKDADLTASELANVSRHGPNALGLVTALIVFLGLRSGANGGPVAVEDADVRHVLLAPISRGVALRHPSIARLRSAAFSGAVAGAIAGQLASRRMPTGTLGSWALWGAAYGAISCALFVIAALIVHGLGIHRSIVTVVATALVVWQAAVTFIDTPIPGPFDAIGSLALTPLRTEWVDFIAVAVALVLAVLSITLISRLSLEALARRSSLVSQLKFAVTLQDIRTVILLRRQLSQEHMRERPWFTSKGMSRYDVVIARGVRSIAHFPARRLGRMIITSTAAAACGVVAYNGTTPAFLATGILLFIFGLDAIEPLSQEVDQPDRTDAFPIERGVIMVKHLVIPAIIAIVFSFIGMAAVVITEPTAMAFAVAPLIALPAFLAGVAGAVVNAVKGAPDPIGESTEALMLPPEMSGMGSLIRAVWPPLIAIAGSLPIIAIRESVASNSVVLGDALRTALAVGIVLFLTVGWVRQRDNIRRWWRSFTAGAQRPQDASS
jgi:hypothetical protein